MYASTVGDREFTFAVSGLLWQRSLVMMDTQTGSLWSHLLGRAMRGEMLDAELEMVPSLMSDWKTWREAYPRTSVLLMPKTSRAYRRDFYRDLGQFVVGMTRHRKSRAWPFDALANHPVVNDHFEELPVLVVFDAPSATAVCYARRGPDGDREFRIFDGALQDVQTGSIWNTSTGKCVRGPLKDEQLRPIAGIVSFREAWERFHPDSTYWRHP